MAAMTSSAAGGSSSRRQEALPRCFRFLAVAPCGSPRLSTSLDLDGVRDPSPPPLPLVLPDQLGMNCCIMRVGSDTEARESKVSQSQSPGANAGSNTAAFGTSACVFVLLSIAMPRRRVPNCNCHRQCFALRLHAGTGEGHQRCLCASTSFSWRLVHLLWRPQMRVSAWLVSQAPLVAHVACREQLFATPPSSQLYSSHTSTSRSSMSCSSSSERMTAPLAA